MTRIITQDEALAMRAALKEIASFVNPAADQSTPGQAAARKARATLEGLGLLHNSDLN
jgi:hypothetical protein